MKFLSEEWLQALTKAFDRGEIADVDVVIQQVVSGTPDGEVSYWLAFKDGDVTGAIGRSDAADVTIIQDYATATDLGRAEINAQAAFMQGRLKVTGNMGKLLQHQAAIQALGPAMASLDAEH
jgi:putative sterol carrier protein